MTTRDERYRAINYAREFLRNLLQKSTRPKNITELRSQALAVLRHFPAEYEVELMEEREEKNS